MIIGHFFSYDQIATSKSRNHGITFTKCQIVVTTDDHVKYSHKTKEDEDRKNVKFLHIRPCNLSDADEKTESTTYVFI